MIQIRPATVADVPILLTMLTDAAVEQGEPDKLVVTAENLVEDGFGPNPLFHALIAEENGAPAGIAVYFFKYSTWVSRLGVYLEDLYVAPAFRRRGVARMLIRQLAQLAHEKGCGRVEWVVHSQNSSAIALYEGTGAAILRDWLLVSLKGAALDRAAADG